MHPGGGVVGISIQLLFLYNRHLPRDALQYGLLRLEIQYQKVGSHSLGVNLRTSLMAKA